MDAREEALQHVGLWITRIRRLKDLRRIDRLDMRRDAMQVAYLATVEALDSYDASRGANKGTWITRKVDQRLWQWCERELHCARLPPSFGMTAENRQKANRVQNATPLDAIDEELAYDAGDLLEQAEIRDAVRQAVASLPERLREVIRLRFECGWTLNQVGRVLGISRERVRQLSVRAFAHLRRRLRRFE